MRRPGARWRTPVIGMVTISLLATGTPGTHASPGGTTPNGSPQHRPLEEPATRVTLITGDRVTVSKDTDGRPVVTGTEAARRPGRPHVAFQTARHGDHLYVLPSDATDLIAQGRVDLGVFDAAYLAANGYADDVTGMLPLIVRYSLPAGLSARADALPASTRTHTLESVDAAAVAVDKDDATTFWTALAAQRGGLAGVWLDRKVEATLDRSVPQIGAPAAWAAGLDGSGVSVAVLDTGVDPEHPDLAGHVSLLGNFTPEPDAVDHHGHGTHVATTIVGSGAASAGSYRGVAPGARLLVGKVLGTSGTGSTSQVIEGMEWAVEHDADIVSMSLAGAPTDGTDPLSEAIDELTATTGTLFVVAAGNTGGPAQKVSAPGSADAALTVAAVDKADRLASFSSRGPRAGDRGLKPDIAAPGVGIVAGRARGTSLGNPVNDHYTSLSGTSMATPHVAGAAAILAQQHPDWTGARLKAALMSTAADVGHTAFEQGTGRVDVARAFQQGVYADGSLDFGSRPYPQTAPTTRTLTYTNDTGVPVTLALTPSLRDFEGGRTPRTMLTINRTSITVPAHGSATVAVTIDPRHAGPGSFQGAVRATGAAGNIALTTTVGVYHQPPTARLAVHTTLPRGATDGRVSATLAIRMDGRDDLDDGRIVVPAEPDAATLAEGVYLVATTAQWKDPGGDWNFAQPVATQVDLTRDRSVTFDLARARKLTVSTPHPTERYDAWFGYQRIGVRGSWQVTARTQAAYGAQNYWVLPTGTVTQGTFRHFDQYLLGAPPVRMTAAGRELRPRYQSLEPEVRKLSGTRDLPLVSAGRGLPEDFAGLDADGKVVLLSLDDLCPGACTGNALDRVTRAANAGAAAVLALGANGRGFLDPARSWPAYPVPTMSLPAGEGRDLVSMLDSRAVTLRTAGVARTPYVYSLKFDDDRAAPRDPGRKVTRSNLARIENRIHADLPTRTRLEWDSQRAGNVLDGSVGLTTTAPSGVTEYVGPLSDTALWWRTMANDYGPVTEAIDVFDRSLSRTEAWGKQPLVPGGTRFSLTARKLGPSVPVFGGTTTACLTCRSDDVFTPMFVLSDGVPGHASGQAWYPVEDSDGRPRYGGEMQLSRDGEQIPVEIREYQWCLLFCFRIYLPAATLAPQTAEYRLTDQYPTQFPGQRYARTVDTSWTFTSSRVTGSAPDRICVLNFYAGTSDPCRAERLLYLGYDVGVGLDNAVPAGRPHTVRITGYHDFSVDPEPELTSLELSVTFDAGEHWQSVPAKAAGDNTYTATVVSPALGDTTGTVGLRTRAVDSAGNTIEQTVHDAYGLRNP